MESELGLARRIAGDYRHRGIEQDDLEQVAFLALVKAAERFDESAGTRFSVFASLTINGEIKRHFRDHGWSVRPPRRVQEDYLAVRSALGPLTQQLHRSPTVAELAEYSGLDEDRVLVALAAQGNYRAKRIAAAGDDDVPHGDEPATDETGYARVRARVDVARMLSCLSERERRIVELRFDAGLTQSAIARDIGVSQVQVSRLLESITTQLRRHEAKSVA